MYVYVKGTLEGNTTFCHCLLEIWVHHMFVLSFLYSGYSHSQIKEMLLQNNEQKINIYSEKQVEYSIRDYIHIIKRKYYNQHFSSNIKNKK